MSPRPDGGEVYPDNVSPIHNEMIWNFESNTPIVDPAVQERIDCKRYESGLCRDCESSRGEATPWCSIHFPWRTEEWTPRKTVELKGDITEPSKRRSVKKEVQP